jgi:hypothetical protein
MTSTAMMKVHQAKLISTGNGRAPRIWISNNAEPKLPEDTAITWNNTVGGWVDQAIRGARLSLNQPTRQGCP